MTEADQVAEGKADRARMHQRDMDLVGTSGKAGGIDSLLRGNGAAGLDMGFDEIGSQRVLAKAINR